MHPLKAISLIAWGGLLLAQISLFWVMASDVYWALLATLPLILPLKGLFVDRVYTYRWIGFLALVYICLGISELVSNAELRLYAFATTICSTLLFLASIYYARYLAGKPA